MLALVGTALPTTAQAQFGFLGLPQIVYDPTAVAKLLTQLSVAQQQLQVLRDNMRKLSHPAWRSVSEALTQIDQVSAAGAGLSYALASIDAEFQRTFPGETLTPTMADDLRAQRARTLATLRNVLAAEQRSAREFTTSVDRLAAMKTQLSTIQSAQQAAELTGAVGIHTAEELTLLRQQLAVEGAAAAIYRAYETNRDAQGAAATTAFEAVTREPAPHRPRRDITQLAF
jgi:P-type conjugative transfer protein TrbJ